MKTTKEIVKEYGKSERNTGAPEVQIALLTHRINQISEHLKTNQKDHHSRFGLVKMVGKRRKMLRYLSDSDNARYQTVLQSLGLRK